MTGQTVIRAVEQEGSLTIDGVEYSIGGVTGQTNKAFIDSATIGMLTPARNALQLVDFEIGEPKERVQWARVRHHAPDAVWPPKGKSLRLDYRMPAAGSSAAAAVTTPSELARQELFLDAFTKMDPSWKLHTSSSHERSSFQNEGKPGEIYTFPNTSVVAERPLPAGTRLVEAEINAGTDPSTSWGPGIALVCRGRSIKFNLRPGGLANVNRPVLGIYDGTKEIPNISGEELIDLARAWTLRIRIDGQTLHFEAKPAAGAWKRYHTLTLPSEAGEPSAFRVGKLDLTGGLTDRDTTGELVRLRINRVAFYSAFDAKLLKAIEE